MSVDALADADALAMFAAMDRGDDTALGVICDRLREVGGGNLLPHVELMWGRVQVFGRLDKTPRRVRAGWCWEVYRHARASRVSVLSADRFAQVRRLGSHSAATRDRLTYPTRSAALLAYLAARVANDVPAHSW